MPLESEEIRQVIKDFRKEFEESFTGEDALKAASQYCNNVLQSKMTKLLEKFFAHREPVELIAILEFIHEQNKKTSQDEKRPGRPKKTVRLGEGMATLDQSAIRPSSA